MDFPIYLAMTAAEMAKCPTLPQKLAYMACHFSAYGTGISNHPDILPECSLLILNDRTPIHKHDPTRVADQLEQLMEATSAVSLLVDFQRPVTEEALTIIQALLSLNFPVAVTEAYAANFDGGVFLSPVPLHKTVQAHTAPWEGRSVWLELSKDPELLTLTPEGCNICPGEDILAQLNIHTDAHLHCHYQINASHDTVQFSLFRTEDDQRALLQEARELGICGAVGLYQEFQDMFYSST